MRRKPALATLACIIVVLITAIGFHDAVAGAVLRILAAGAGYAISYDRFHAGIRAATVLGLHMTNRGGEPVFDAERIDLQYSLRDLLPGGKRRFGLSAVDVARPALTLIHHPDGTYNVALPAAGPAQPNLTPIDVRARLRDGSVLLIDRFTVAGQERRQRIVGITADAVLQPNRRSFYNVRFDLDDARTLHRVTGKATFDPARGFAAQRWIAASLPIGPLVDFGLSSHALNLVAGTLRDLDARVYTIDDEKGIGHTHVGVRATLADGVLYVAGIEKPLRGARGTLVAYDNGITTTGIEASLASVPIHIVGGIYGRAAPQVAFTLQGRGPLDRLRTIASATRRQPLSGDLTFMLRANGALAQPVITGAFSAPAVTYRAFRFDHPGGTIAFSGRDVEILDAHVGYGPASISAGGSLQLERRVATDLVATVNGNGDGLPYVGQIIRGMHVGGVLTLSGIGERLATTGIAYGDAPGGHADALFDVDGNGNGFVGPISIERGDGASIYARVEVDRGHNTVSGMVAAKHFSLLPALPLHLSGLGPARVPDVRGTIDADLAGAVDGGRLDAAAGTFHLSRGRFAGIDVPSFDAAVTGAAGVVALDGRLRAAIGADAPAGLRLRGSVDAPIRVLADGATTVLQLPNLRFTRASVDGISLDDGFATVSLNDGSFAVKAARLGIGGGSVVAAGRVGGTTDLAATASGIGLSGGQLVANIHAGGTLQRPAAAVAVVLDGARVCGMPLAANAFARYAGRRLIVDDATVFSADGSLNANGTAGPFSAGEAPSLDLRATLRGAQLAALNRIVRLPLRYPDGELDADLRATGPLDAPRLAGTVRIPLGSINGLIFRDARVAIAGSRGGIALNGGSVRVGSTAVAFSSDLGAAVQRIAVHAPHANLADFNDYFDAADTLGGSGRLAVDARLAPGAIRTNGEVAFAGASFRRIPVGNVSASWRTAGRTVHGRADLRSAHGNADLVSGVTFPAIAPLNDPLHRATIDATGQIAGLDLATWLPLTGMTLPVGGTVDASLRAHGVPVTPNLTATGDVRNAVAGRFALDALHVALAADRRSARITSARLSAPGLSVDAGGTFGYAPGDPIAIALRARSDDLGLLAKSVHLAPALAGTAVADLQVSGTRADPRIVQTLEADNLRSGKLVIGRAHAVLIADRRNLQLQSAELDTGAGRVLAAGSVPIAFTPPNFALRDAPLTLSLRAEDLQLGQFAPVLPSDWHIAGRLDGGLAAAGSVRTPILTGTLALTGGSYASSLVHSALTNVRAQLALERGTARLNDVHANVGGGAIDGVATASFADLRDVRRTLAVDGQLAIENAGINLNQLFSGKVNGTLRAHEVPGSPVALGGTLAFSQTRLPLNALLPGKPNSKAAPFPIAIAFDDLKIEAGSDVRVQSANVDVGARGRLDVRGTLTQPVLAGGFTSTDGTLSFYRSFVLQQARVAFSPADGIVPDIDATATTHVPNPDTDVLLHVTGPATQLNVELASNPNYDREQILGLLVNAQAFGAVPGVQTAQGGFGGPSISSLAGGYLSTALTRSLLEPIGGQLGSALGLQDLALGYDFNGGFSAGLQRTLSKHFTATFGDTFGPVQRESLGLRWSFADATGLQLSLYGSGNGAVRSIGTTTPFAPNGPTNLTLLALEPPDGSSGYVITYQRKFK